mgnify:CR=1 FL=1
MVFITHNFTQNHDGSVLLHKEMWGLCKNEVDGGNKAKGICLFVAV